MQATEAQNNSDLNKTGWYFFEIKICKRRAAQYCHWDSASQNPTRWAAFPPMWTSLPWGCGPLSFMVQDGRSSISCAYWVHSGCQDEEKMKKGKDVCQLSSESFWQVVSWHLYLIHLKLTARECGNCSFYSGQPCTQWKPGFLWL